MSDDGGAGQPRQQHAAKKEILQERSRQDRAEIDEEPIQRLRLFPDDTQDHVFLRRCPLRDNGEKEQDDGREHQPAKIPRDHVLGSVSGGQAELKKADMTEDAQFRQDRQDLQRHRQDGDPQGSSGIIQGRVMIIKGSEKSRFSHDFQHQPSHYKLNAKGEPDVQAGPWHGAHALGRKKAPPRARQLQPQQGADHPSSDAKSAKGQQR